MFKWFKGRDWLFRRPAPWPKPIAELTRKYWILNSTSNPDQKKWVWDKEPIWAQNAIEAVRQAYLKSSAWVNMNYEIVWCSQTQEKLYVKTEYVLHDKDNFTMLWDKPESNPTELEPKVAVSKSDDKTQQPQTQK